MAEQNPHEEDAAMLDPNEAEEIVEDDGDAAMDSGDEDDGQGEVQQTIQLQNDSVAHFDGHKDSVYCVAQHPLRPELVATGGGDDTAYLWDATPEPGPVLPASYETNPQPKERKSQEIVARLGPQDETVNAIAFTLPRGEFIVTGTAAGTLNVFTTPTSQSSEAKLVASAKEVDDITWILPCPSSNEQYANTIALGAADGSVWVYTIEGQSLNMVQSFFLHQTPCTAGAWTPGGQLLATVDEASSLFVWDVFGEAAAAGVTNPNGSQALIQLTAEDERFKVDGGLYSAAISPGGGIVAVGGAFGNVRVVSLPRLSAQQQSTVGTKGAGAKAKAGGAKQAPAASSTGNFGQILAAFAAQTDGIETLDFSQPPLTLLAAGSVDGSIAIFDAAKNFSVRRHIKDAHALDEVPHAVIKVEFTKTPLGTANPRGHLLTSCGNDGVVRRWDVRGGMAASAEQGLLKEWKGHIENDGERGGILGFVQGNGSSESGVAGKYVVTAGDDGVSLVFDWKE